MLTTDGMGNWLRRARQPGQIRNHPKVYESNFNPLFKLSVP